MDELLDVRRALTRPPVRLDGAEVKQCAVAMILGPGRSMWLVKRATSSLDPWSGHLAFPGGRRDPGDADLLATAVRETMEEVGVDLRAAELLGELDDLAARPMRSLMVRPFVFRVDAAPQFRTNYEIASVHVRSLDGLLAGVGRGTMRWPLSMAGVTLPCVDVDGARLWGLTLAMVDDLLDRLDGRGVGLRRPVYGG